MELVEQRLRNAVGELVYRFDNSALSHPQNLETQGISYVDSNFSSYRESEDGSFYTASYVQVIIGKNEGNWSQSLMWWIAVDNRSHLFEISCQVDFSNQFTYDLYRQRSSTVNEALKSVEIAVEICLEDIEFSLAENRFLELKAVEDQESRTLLFHPLRSPP